MGYEDRDSLMPANTPNRAYTYSLPADPADVPAALQELAQDIDTDVCNLLNTTTIRPSSKFRGTGSFASQTPSALGPTVGTVRVPFNTTDFNNVTCTMQSQEVGNRLIKPDVPGFYMVLATLDVPILTLSTAVQLMLLEVRKCDTTAPTVAGSLLGMSSHHDLVSFVDRGVRRFTVGTTAFMDGVDDAFSLEFTADTNPDVAEYIVGERSMTILRMTTS